MTYTELEHAFTSPSELTQGHGLRGDADLNPDMHPNPRTPPALLIAAAVLVPIIRRPEGETVLFTVRHRMLKRHPGQISFPGGRTDPGDADAVATALRETQEEVGIPPEAVRVLGQLECYVTRTGYCVTPVVGVVDTAPSLLPADAEVEEVFEAPLAFVLDPRNQLRESRDADGRSRNFYAIRFGPRFIWGATAGMLVSLGEFVRRHRGAL